MNTHQVLKINNRTARHPPNRSKIYKQKSQKAILNFLHRLLFVLKSLAIPLFPYGSYNAMWCSRKCKRSQLSSYSAMQQEVLYCFTIAITHLSINSFCLTRLSVLSIKFKAAVHTKTATLCGPYCPKHLSKGTQSQVHTSNMCNRTQNQVQ